MRNKKLKNNLRIILKDKDNYSLNKIPEFIPDKALPQIMKVFRTSKNEMTKLEMDKYKKISNVLMYMYNQEHEDIERFSKVISEINKKKNK